MLQMLLFLLQAPPQKVQWWMWTLAILFFLLGLGLLIYLMTRPKLTEQEEELELRPRKVLSDIAPDDPDAPKSDSPLFEEPATPATADEPQTSPILASEARQDSGTELLASPLPHDKAETEQPETLANQTANLWHEAAPQKSMVTVREAEIAEPEAVPILATEPETTNISAVEETFTLTPKATSRLAGETSVFAEVSSTQRHIEDLETPPKAGTQPLASNQVTNEPPVITTTAMEAEDVWEDLDFSGSHTAELATPTEADAPPIPSPSDKATRPYLQTFPESPSASVSERQTTDLLRTRSMREPFEPPRIEPIAPQSQPAPVVSTPAPPPVPPMPDAGTQAFSSTSRPTQVYTTSDRGTREFSTPDVPYEAPVVQPATQPVYETAQQGRINRPAGSILGLPVAATQTPMIFGQPVKSRDEIGVTGFANYDKPQDAGEKRWGGLMAILLVVLLVGGATLAYFRIPAVHGLVDKLRGIEQPKPVETVKAQIIPAYPPEVNKKMVKAKGAVINTSDQTLENLAVEMALYRGVTLEGTRTIAVTPTTLEAGKQGEYVFEYDGSNAGFSRYAITKLMSNGSEVKFSIPKP